MQYRRLGNSSLEVSEIALGSWLTYGGAINDETARECVRTAFDCGINFFDTANVYATGGAEAFLGDMLSDYRRDEYLLATKLYFPMTDSDRGLSAAQVHKQIDASLARLRTDYVDLYQCHRYDDDTPLDETMHALTEVVEAGKARFIGFSEWTADQVRSAMSLPGVSRFVSSQPQYSMLWREPEKEVIPYCDRHGIGQIVWSPLAQGVLTGKYDPATPPPADSRAANDSMSGFMTGLMQPRVLAAVQDLAPIAADLGLTMAQMALAWVLRIDNVSAAIVGASRPQQVRDNASASGISLTPETLTKIDQILGPAILSGGD
ncbi:MAG: aldo/keto reductase family protein [Gammaproteobacteria bacterium]|nr:aldo/keto reductase family protein [Gammaproteobacteria bacterium]NND61060.1 aldo/keto reductase family protein [Gammaproteobacteria bacterium]